MPPPLDENTALLASGESTPPWPDAAKVQRRPSVLELSRTATEALLAAEASNLAQSRRTTRAEGLDISCGRRDWASSRTGLGPRRRTPAPAWGPAQPPTVVTDTLIMCDRTFRPKG